MFGLICLPYEVLANIVGDIDFDDVLNLGLSCKALRYLLTEESICKIIVQTKIPYSNEALEAEKSGGGYSSALRRAVKRREALATANPYIVATVGFGDAYLYCKGVLCYTLDDKVRVLDLHHSAQREVVISIPLLLTQALADIEDNSTGTFQVLYYSDKIISCIYKSCDLDSIAWLVAFSLAKRRILVAQELDSTEKIFVRHNDRFLYYGTHSEVGVDGYKKWVIHGYDIGNRTWFGQKVHLPDMVGCEMNSTICFEFHDKYFYALSNQTSFEVEEIDWTSFYHCIRFPLDSPCNELLEKTENHSMWRRQHQEGPIDDRWTSLRLESDEGTGELKIVEARKEWTLGSSRSQRTYYTTKIIFPVRCQDDDMGFECGTLPTVPISYASSSTAISSSSSGSASISSSNSGSSASSASSTSSNSTHPSSNSPASTATSTASRKHHVDLSTLPDDPILKLLRPDDNPHHMTAPPRLAHETHPGNDGSTKPSITLSKCRIRSYHTSCSAFLDLVDDPLPDDWQGTQRLRLRSGARKLGPPLVHPSSHPTKAGFLREASNDLPTALQELYIERDISLWPPPQDPSPFKRDADVDAVYKLLNPPTHLGNVEGTADERSMVYVTGGFDKPQAIIFVGFDPKIKLVGLKPWGIKGVGEGPHIDGRASGWCGSGEEVGEQEEKQTQMQTQTQTQTQHVTGGGRYVDVLERDRTVVVETKGKGKEKFSAAFECAGGETVVEVRKETGRDVSGSGVVKRNHWAWREPAMYCDIGLGFYFGKEKKR